MQKSKTLTGIEREKILESRKLNLFQRVIENEIGHCNCKLLKDPNTHTEEKQSLSLSRQIRR